MGTDFRSYKPMFLFRKQSFWPQQLFGCGANKLANPHCSPFADNELTILAKSVAAASVIAIAVFSMKPALARSLTVFAVANEYCEKRELGMSKDEALRHAMNYVMTNSMFDPDYNLPNFSKLVTREIYEKCPQYLKK
jgi:hypothetical protein